MKEITDDLYDKLSKLGIICDDNDDTRSYNVGSSNYSSHIIQPWSIWIDWDLNPWDADIVKRVLREKDGEPRERDYDKIIHNCLERKRQLRNGQTVKRG